METEPEKIEPQKVFLIGICRRGSSVPEKDEQVKAELLNIDRCGDFWYSVKAENIFSAL